MKVHQYGLPRAATKATKWVLEKNLGLRVLTAEGGSKHAPCMLADAGVQVSALVVTVKDPLAWLDSMYRYILRASHYVGSRASLDDFLGSRYAYPLRDGRLWWPNPIEAWNCMNRHWICECSLRHQVIAVRAESLLTPERATKALESVAAMLGRSMPQRVRLPERRLQIVPGAKAIAEDHPVPEGPMAFDPSYYLEHRYLREWTPAQVEQAWDMVDRELAGKLQYAPPVVEG